MNELKYLTEYYQNYDEDGRLLSKHGQVEFLTTMRYIHKYLKRGMKILEIGAGTGRYSVTLAEKGFEVDAVELVEHNINILKNKIKPSHRLMARQGNAVDLSAYESNMFDITLVLGPLYHLFDEKDKKAAISEAIRVTKKDGIIFAAYCMNEATVIHWGFKGENIKKAVEDGMLDKSYKCMSTPSLLFEMHRKNEIDKLMKDFPIERLHFLGSDMFTLYMRDTVNNMDDETFKIFLDYHFSICERSDLVGLTNHGLDIFKKL